MKAQKREVKVETAPWQWIRQYRTGCYWVESCVMSYYGCAILVRHFDILKMNISLHDEEKERTNQTINTKHTMTPYQIPYPKQPYTTILINLQPTFNKCSLHSNLRLWRKRGTIMCSTILGEYYISKPLLSVMKTNGDERRHQWPGSWSILSTFGFEFYSSYM